MRLMIQDSGTASLAPWASAWLHTPRDWVCRAHSEDRGAQASSEAGTWRSGELGFRETCSVQNHKWRESLGGGGGCLGERQRDGNCSWATRERKGILYEPLLVTPEELE